MPHFSSANFHADPTHRHAFRTRRVDYFVEGKTLARILPAENINFVLEVVK